MSLKKQKPPLPFCSVIHKSPALFTIPTKRLQKECDEYNRKQEEHNKRESDMLNISEDSEGE